MPSQRPTGGLELVQASSRGEAQTGDKDGRESPHDLLRADAVSLEPRAKGLTKRNPACGGRMAAVTMVPLRGRAAD